MTSCSSGGRESVHTWKLTPWCAHRSTELSIPDVLCGMLESGHLGQGVQTGGAAPSPSVENFDFDRLAGTTAATAARPQDVHVALDRRTWPSAVLVAVSPHYVARRRTRDAEGPVEFIAIAAPNSTSVALLSESSKLTSVGLADVKDRVCFLSIERRGESVGHHERVTALAVLALPRSAGLACVVAVGYASGRVRLFSPDGKQLMVQRLNSSAVARIQFRSALGDPAQCGQDLVVVFSGGIVASIEGSSLYTVLRTQVQNSVDATGAEATLAYRLWKLGGQNVSDAVTTSSTRISSPFGFLHPVDSSNYRIVGVGSMPIVGFFTSSDKESHVVRTVAFVSSVATAVASKVLNSAMSFARNWWTAVPVAQLPPAHPEPQQPIVAEAHLERPVRLAAHVWLTDSDRTLAFLELDPLFGRFLLCPDNLGRVLLVDASSHVICKMWKGYRNAQVGWLIATNPQESTQSKIKLFKRASSSSLQLRAVLYAPIRGIIEIWSPSVGLGEWNRIAFEEVAQHGRLILPPRPLGFAMDADLDFMAQCAILDNQCGGLGLSVNRGLVDAGSDSSCDSTLQDENRFESCDSDSA